jgi:lipopolysaccharide export system permease protein
MLIPLLATALLLSCGLFVFNEGVSLDASRSKRMLSDEALGVRSQSDNRNVTLRSSDPKFLLHAGRYIDETERISDVNVVVTDASGNLSKRIQAVSGEYVEGHWILYDATVHEMLDGGNRITTAKMPVFDDKQLTLEPGLFRNLGTDIKTMELISALQYVQRLRIISASQYPVVSTDLYARLFSNLTPFVLSLVACSSVFNWKKNVLVLSIIASLSIAIVYYVLQMVSMILAKQGVVQPIWGPLTPMLILMLTTPIVAHVARK